MKITTISALIYESNSSIIYIEIFKNCIQYSRVSVLSVVSLCCHLFIFIMVRRGSVSHWNHGCASHSRCFCLCLCSSHFPTPHTCHVTPATHPLYTIAPFSNALSFVNNSPPIHSQNAKPTPVHHHPKRKRVPLHMWTLHMAQRKQRNRMRMKPRSAPDWES